MGRGRGRRPRSARTSPSRVVLGDANQLVSPCRFETRAEARRAIISCTRHYNATRLRSALGNVPRTEWEPGYRLGGHQAR